MILYLFIFVICFDTYMQECRDQFMHNNQVCVVRPEIKYFENVDTYCQQIQSDDFVPEICKEQVCSEQECQCLHGCLNYQLEQTCNSKFEIFDTNQQEKFCQQFCFAEIEQNFHSQCDQKFCDQNFCQLQQCIQSTDNLQVCSLPSLEQVSYLLSNDEYCRNQIEFKQCQDNDIQVNCNQEKCDMFQCLFNNRNQIEQKKHVCLWNQLSPQDYPLTLSIEQFCKNSHNQNLSKVQCNNEEYCNNEEECCLNHCLQNLQESFQGTCNSNFDFILDFNEFCLQRCQLNIAQCDQKDCSLQQCEQKKCQNNLVLSMCDSQNNLISANDICNTQNYSQLNFHNCNNKNCTEKDCQLLNCVEVIKSQTDLQYLCLQDHFRPVYFSSPQDFCIQNPINNFDVEDIIECDDCNNNDGCCMGGCIQKYNHEEGCFNGRYYLVDDMCRQNCTNYKRIELDKCIFQKCNKERCQEQYENEDICEQSEKYYCLNNGEVSNNLCSVYYNYDLKIAFECPKNCDGKYRNQYCQYMCSMKHQTSKEVQLIFLYILLFNYLIWKIRFLLVQLMKIKIKNLWQFLIFRIRILKLAMSKKTYHNLKMILILNKSSSKIIYQIQELEIKNFKNQKVKKKLFKVMIQQIRKMYQFKILVTNQKQKMTKWKKHKKIQFLKMNSKQN